MINKYLQQSLFLVIFYGSSCKEVFSQGLDKAQKMLVVDGLLSDESNTIKVRLSNTVPFHDQAYLLELSALVIVNDDLCRKFSFIEKNPGNYESKAFNYEYGRTNTLTIKTSKNKYDRSTPQTPFLKLQLESVSDEVTSKTMQTTRNGKLVLRTLLGLEFFTTLNDTTSSSPFFRVSSIIMAEYTKKPIWLNNHDSLRFNFYFWKKYYQNRFFNLNELKYHNLIKHKHSIAFCPFDTIYFTVVKDEIWTTIPPPKLISIYYKSFYYFVIPIKKYQLNADVNQYYKDINVRLESKNHILDSVSFQAKGNFICENDLDEPLGVFEVSSANLHTYSFSNFRGDKSIKYEEIAPKDLDDIVDASIVYNTFQPFWIS